VNAVFSLSNDRRAGFVPPISLSKEGEALTGRARHAFLIVRGAMPWIVAWAQAMRRDTIAGSRAPRGRQRFDLSALP